MNFMFYPKLALDGIRKNRRLYIPYVITGACMVMMHYIVSYLSDAQYVTEQSRSLTSVLNFGETVIAVFSLIFLFYSGSFLMRRRKKEFGLYSVLGMSRKNIARVILWESLIACAFSVAAGLAAGIALSKFAELALLDLFGGKVEFGLFVSPDAVLWTALKFFLIFAAICAVNLLRTVRLDTVTLMKSEKTGEKAPKGNFVFGAAGVLILAAAYWIASTVSDPANAFMMFFIAVLMVITATYLIMISGSVALCGALKRNKRYYYKKKHFISVSQMAYRMKRNGAGLASVCILSTCVLVTISTTFCLYKGTDDMIAAECPTDVSATFYFYGTKPEAYGKNNISAIRDFLAEEVSKAGGKIENGSGSINVTVYGKIDGDKIVFTGENRDTRIVVSSSNGYGSPAGAAEDTPENAVKILTENCGFGYDTLTFEGGKTYSVVSCFEAEPFEPTGISTLTVVVPDFEDTLKDMIRVMSPEDAETLTVLWRFDFDTGGGGSSGAEISWGDLRKTARQRGLDFSGIYGRSRDEVRKDRYGVMSSILFTGVILSIVFAFAAVLIMYYKQICEGYEDKSRFDLMMKVGMTKRDIKKSINSQLLTVFFLPLAGAGMHLFFAFPMIKNIMKLAYLNNTALFAITTLVTFAVFALLYAAAYKLTSGAYYAIVSDEKTA